jgi:MFS family permease
MPGPLPDSRASWVRLAIGMALSTVGGVGMWAVVVVLPSVQAQFGVDRGEASLSYTAVMLGFALGSAVMGRVTDRFGIRLPMCVASVALAAGYVLAGSAGSLWSFSLIHFALIGMLGASITFGPMMAHVSLWFDRRRGIAVSLCASGNYIAGAFWPPVLQHFVAVDGWRATYVGIGVFCAATMLPMALLLRGKPPAVATTAGRARAQAAPFGLSPAGLQVVLIVAGLACCIAMATPQVHLVAYCVDLGYGASQGARMLSLMLGLGIVSRVGSGWLADRIGGLRTLLLGSVLQGITLLLYFQFDGLTSLYLISATFGLVQGGIIPSYTMIVRECFTAREAGARVGLVLLATMCGMALGGWMAGAMEDWTGSYRLAFANGALWNALNVGIVLTLLLRQRGGAARAARLSSSLGH